MDVADFLSRLEGVRGRNGSWVARCPAHADRTPSLTVKELGDGRILIHDFGGCGTEAILSVLGLTMGDLFPEPLAHRLGPRRAFTASDALRCLASESAVLALSAADLSDGQKVDADRVLLATSRIADALELVHGG